MKIKIYSLLLSVCLITFILGISVNVSADENENAGGYTATYLSSEQTNITIGIGEKVYLNEFSDSSYKLISDNEKAAVVTSGCNVTGISYGKAKISVLKNGTQTAVINVNVKKFAVILS